MCSFKPWQLTNSVTCTAHAARSKFQQSASVQSALLIAGLVTWNDQEAGCSAADKTNPYNMMHETVAGRVVDA